MIILKEKVAGYNNTLTLATKDMKFGSNAKVNYSKPKELKVSPQTSPNPIPSRDQNHNTASVPRASNNLIYLLGVMFVGGIVTSRWIFFSY